MSAKTLYLSDVLGLAEAVEDLLDGGVHLQGAELGMALAPHVEEGGGLVVLH